VNLHTDQRARPIKNEAPRRSPDEEQKARIIAGSFLERNPGTRVLLSFVRAAAPLTLPEEEIRLMDSKMVASVFRRLKSLSSICLVLALALLAAQGQPAANSAGVPAPPPLLLGAAWYPEQWPESRWNADLDLMQKAHMHMVRIGEFAWSSLEPQEGKYDLDWMERAIDLAGRHGIYVVIGTPTCTPPAWLTQKYPETLRTLETGRLAAHGERGQFNWANGKYRELARGIDEQLARRFGHNPYVIAWQIDNEYSFASFDANTRAQFQDWLQARYGTLDKLNQAWTTAYWSESYSSWEQIPIASANGNPGLVLDWKRFASDTWRSYQRNQIDEIRRYADPRQRITNNMMGWFDGFDHYVVSRDLDFAAWDDPISAGHLDPIRNGAAHDLTRGFKHQNFWVMETTAGPTTWNNGGTIVDKGEMRATIWHDIGHGADTISYWQWRDGLNGQEQNHGAIVDVDGDPDPIYGEIAQAGEEMEKAASALRGTTVESKVAILHSYDSRWTLSWQRMVSGYDPIEDLLSYYKPLHKLGNSVDIVSPESDLSKYRLVVAPALNVLPQTVADHLIDYVKEGGNLVLGMRSGMKDGSNARWRQRQPGPLAQTLGGRVEQYFGLQAPVPVSGVWGASQASIYEEQLTVLAPDVAVLMRYGASNGWLDNQPAAITRKVGRGTITYLGMRMDPEGMERAVHWMLESSGVHADLPPAPEGVEVYRRSGQGRQVFIFENLSHASQTVTLPHAMRDVLIGGMAHAVTLPVYGVAVLSDGE
jgi:beta-galactosidase